MNFSTFFPPAAPSAGGGGGGGGGGGVLAGVVLGYLLETLHTWMAPRRAFYTYTCSLCVLLALLVTRRQVCIQKCSSLSPRLFSKATEMTSWLFNSVSPVRNAKILPLRF
ncbi:hypothetical protein E2C01_093976 [Portunus trituberculatus]|uniref:Uncharacterized protein n=1 Tax=Portunus trituberculatus TaxID=210409 RepID=A0A5B7JR97_PORTR|nr:hypothetical protein [Portunus trituberculatus]